MFRSGDFCVDGQTNGRTEPITLPARGVIIQCMVKALGSSVQQLMVISCTVHKVCAALSRGLSSCMHACINALMIEIVTIGE
jgi:hypothetical protein